MPTKTKHTGVRTMPLPFLDRSVVDTLMTTSRKQREDIIFFLASTAPKAKAMPAMGKPDKPIEESLAFLNTLCVRGEKPVPADIDDFGLLAEKYL